MAIGYNRLTLQRLHIYHMYTRRYYSNYIHVILINFASSHPQ